MIIIIIIIIIITISIAIVAIVRYVGYPREPGGRRARGAAHLLNDNAGVLR